MNLKHLTDKSLLNDTKQLAQEYRAVTTKLLHHLREIEKRRLFSDLGYNSLFHYVVQELGFSEGSAARRIKAARLLEEIPEIEGKIEKGDLTLSNIALVADAFKKEEIKDKEFKMDVLLSIENTSARICEKTLLEITGPKDLPKRELRPVSTNKTLLSIVLSDKELGLYEEIKSLYPYEENFWEKVFSVALDQIKNKKFHLLSKSPLKDSSTRYIPSSLKKAVYERDKKCQNCGSKYALEFDHIKPFALGGKTELKNLRLLCRSCNQRARLLQKFKAPKAIKIHR